MRPLFLATIALFLPLSFLLAAEPPTRASDEAVIHQIWAKFEAAFNRGDSKTAASVFAVDGDRMDSFGQFFQGRAAIERSYVDLFSGAYKGGTTSSTVRTFRYITPDVVLVEIDSKVTGLPGMTTPRILRATTIYVRRDGKWEIAAHRPRVRPQPAPSTKS